MTFFKLYSLTFFGEVSKITLQSNIWWISKKIWKSLLIQEIWRDASKILKLFNFKTTSCITTWFWFQTSIENILKKNIFDLERPKLPNQLQQVIKLSFTTKNITNCSQKSICLDGRVIASKQNYIHPFALFHTLNFGLLF